MNFLTNKRSLSNKLHVDIVMYFQGRPRYEFVTGGVGTGVTISSATYNQVLAEACSLKATRTITRDLFPKEYLKCHSALGKRSSYPGVEERKLEAMKSK